MAADDSLISDTPDVKIAALGRVGFSDASISFPIGRVADDLGSSDAPDSEMGIPDG